MSGISDILELISAANTIRRFAEKVGITYEEASNDINEMTIAEFIEKYERLASE